MPFIGEVTGIPSILNGKIDDMVEEAKNYCKKGVYGIDLLGYRYVGDVALLNETIINAISAPVCLAGSIDSYMRLDEVNRVSPWGFTIGGAFFEKKFGRDMVEQINKVYDYMAL